MTEKISRGRIKLILPVGILLITLVSFAHAAFAAFGDGKPTIANPSVFTLQDSKAKVDGASGAFTQHVTIDIPPGRNGIQPDLALDYNSQNTQDSIVGYGWSLSIPYIERLNKTGSNNLYGPSPFYTSSIDGELATTSTSTPNSYRARVDDGSYRSYSFSSNTWTVYDKNGTRYLFGQTDQSRQGTTTSQSYRWMLEEIRDTNSNYVKFTYLKDSNQIYPAQITYTGNGVADGPATITFATSTRPDTYYSYKPGFKVTTSYRISQITVTFNGTMVRQYALSYTSGTNGNRSLLSSIQETGKDDAGSQLTLPAMSFSYVNATSTLFYTPSSATLPVNGQSFVVSDTNGNGINDVNEFYFSTSTNATGSKMFIDQATTSTNIIPPEWWTNIPDPPTPQERGVRYLDVNGDGKADIARGLWDNVAGTSTQKLYVNNYATSTGYAWTLATTTGNVTFSFTNPTAYWKFDESSGDAADSTANGHTLTNNNVITYGAAKINNGANLASSSSQYFSVADNSDFDAATGFSACTWIKLRTLPNASEETIISKLTGDGLNEAYVVAFGASTANDVYVGWTDTGTFGGSHGATYFSTTGYWTSSDVDVWRHFCVAANATNSVVKVYKDGVATTLTNTGSTVTSIYNGSSPFFVGKFDQIDAIRYFDGNIDEMAFYKNYVLTQSDVNTLYNSGSGISYPYATSTSVQTGIVPTFLWHGAGTPANVTTGIFGDVNGDKFPDYVLSLDTVLSGIPANSTYLGNGSAWDLGTTAVFVAPKKLPAATSTITNSMLIDINGDGLADWMYSDATSTHVLLNTGVGWESSPDTHWDISTTTLFQVSSTTPIYDRGMRFFDINGDGLPDYIRSYNVTASGGCSSEATTTKLVMLNTGSGWATSTAYTLPAYITSGDGSGSPCTFNEYANWNGNGQMKQDVISTVNYAKGGSTDVSYGLTTQLGGNNQLPYSLLVVTSLINHDGRGSNEETDYTYGGGLQYNPTNPRDQKFGGFGTTTETRSDRITTTYYDQGDAVQSYLGEQTDGYAQINHPYREDVFTPANVLVKKTLSKWDTVAHGASTFVGLVRQLVQSYAADGTHRDSATEYLYSSTTDDLTEMDQYGEVNGNSDGTFTDISGDSRTTLITYAASSSVNMSVPDRKRIIDNSAATSSDTKLYYDSLAFGSVNIGNQTKQEDWITGSTYASSTKTYNSFGLPTQSKDRDGNGTTFVYDSFNLYPATTTNALSQSATSTYNYSNGKVKQTTDPNGRLLRNTYDAVGRLTLVEQSDTANPASYVTKAAFGFVDSTSTFPTLAHETDYLNAATSTNVYDFYDGLGRLVQERKSTEDTASSSVSDLTYNTAGLLGSKSLPYFSAGASSTAISNTSALFTNYTYDPLGRTATIANAVGTTTMTYGRWTATTTDAVSHSKDYTSDAFNNLVKVQEYLPAVASTTYAYDAANNLTKITDALSNVRNFTYDGLGRRLTAQDLHPLSKATFGSWAYTYDDAGNMTSQTDPKSQVVNRTYDALNRMLTEDYAGGAGTEVTNTYDNCTYGIGYLCTASSTSALTSNAYDILGRVSIATTTIINASSSAMSYTYDRQGNVTNATYPNGSQVAYTYNTAGQIESVSHATSSGAFSFIVSNFDYGPTNLPTLKAFGSGAVTTFTYDPNALYRLTRIATVGTTTGLADLATHASAYWKLDESSGTAADASGNGHTLTNNNIITYAAAKINNGATLASASSQYFSLADNNDFDASTGFSVCTWIKFTAIPGANYETLFEKGDGNTQESYRVAFSVASNNDVYVVWSANGTTDVGQYKTATGYWTTADNGVWRHFCVTADAANGVVKAYKDGVATTLTQVGQVNSIFNSTSEVEIGQFDVNDHIRYLNASIDEAVFFKNYVLSSAEVSQLYNGGSGVQLTFGGPGSEMLQDLNYSYDKVGNITAISDVGSTTARKSAAFGYDFLNRLTSAYTITASSSPYTFGYTYDFLGNITAGGTVSTSASTTVPQAYWKFDESSGDASDSSGNGHALTNTNTIAYSPGKVNNAANLASSSSQYFSTADSADFAASSSFSFCSWVKLNTLPASSEETIFAKQVGGGGATDSYVVAFGASTANDVYVGWSDNGTFSAGHRAQYNTATGYWTSGDVGVWRHFCVTADATNGIVKAYKDGAATTLTQTLTVASIFNGTAPVIVGRFDSVDSIRYLDASVDEARFWKNYVVTSTEVSSLYNGSATTSPSTNYTYAGTSYANPDAATMIGNGIATSTYWYDYNGNLASTTGATSTNYVWDYANRLTAAGVGGATSTYGYDGGINRVYQITPSATTTYPMKFYSTITSKSGATTTATTTEYIYAGDTLLATVDQLLSNNAATGTPTTHYIHPDHLGSTNVISDSNMSNIQTLDYFPYGNIRVNSSTGKISEGKKYIGQFFDDPSQLSYLNARYYDPGRGQFLSEDPVFWSGQNLEDPQSLNGYSYANDNPVTKKDPNGNLPSLADLYAQLIKVLQELSSLLGGGGGGGVSSGSTQGGQGSAAPQSKNTGGGGGYVSVPLPNGYVEQRTAAGCFDACGEMLGYIPDPNHRIITMGFNDNKQLTPQAGAQQGIRTIDSYLTSGRPIEVGLNINGGAQSLNVGHEQTQHAVIINGTGTDAGGKYYHFVDPYHGHGMNPENKLYLNSDNSLSGPSTYGTGKTFTVTEVRPR